MNKITVIFKIEYLLFKRNTIAFWALLLFAGFSIYAIYYGHSEIRRQQLKMIAAADSVNNAQTAYIEKLNADTTKYAGKQDYEMAVFPSLVRFNFNFFVADYPTPLAELSLGQRDLYPYYYILNAQSLYIQTLKGDINNPFKLSTGNFDLAFVFIYLFPLLIIVLCFDLVSSEYEQGTYPLLTTTNVSFRSIVVIKLLFRYLITSLMIVLLSIAGFWLAGVNLIADIFPVLFWVFTLLVYGAIWFAIIFLINSFRKSTAFNAMVSLATWVLLLIIIPSLLNIYVQTKRQIHSTQLAGLMRNRNMPETDEAMHKALSAFYILHPGLRPIDTVKTPYFYYQGYSAFLFLNDRNSKKLIDEYNDAIAERNKVYQLFNPINPAVNAQELLNHLSATDLSAEINFKNEYTRFHQQIFWFSNTPLFKNRLMNSLDYLRQPGFRRHRPLINYGYVGVNLALLFLSFICLFLIGYKKLRDQTLNKSLLA